MEPKVVREVPPWVEKLAWVMDSSIPLGRGISIGLDGLIGLVPGVGDLAGAIVSLLILAAGVRARLPRSAIARMAVNLGLDALLGTVPLAGDVFDFAFKANEKNLRIFRDSLAGRRSGPRDWAFVAAVFLALSLVLTLPIVGFILLLGAHS